MFEQIRKIHRESPRRFWVIVVAFFIDSVGGTLLFPFFSLYITGRFDVGMTQAGIVLAFQPKQDADGWSLPRDRGSLGVLPGKFRNGGPFPFQSNSKFKLTPP